MTKPENGTHGRRTRTLFLILLAGFFLIVAFGLTFVVVGEAVAEDPVTGSAHSMLIPYWAAKLNKTQMLARQVSERGGDLRCQLAGTRVYISGQAITYLTGKVLLR